MSASEATDQGKGRWADLLELSYEPMLVWRLDGPIEFWNVGAQRLYGFASDEALGRDSHALLQTKFPVEYTQLRWRLRNEGLWFGELRHTCKGGREVIVDSRMQLLADDSVLEVNRDVTGRKHLEAALRESEQRLRWLAAVVEFGDDAIVSKSLDGIITSWNSGAERIFGYSAEEAVGQPITIVIPQDRLNEERTILTRIRRGERIDHFETVRQHKRGTLIAVSVSVSPVKDTNGTIVGASKVARDITERELAQKKIVTLAREAEHRSKNVLATVQATVMLSRADTVDDLKQVINGRIQALANVNSLFVAAHWIGAELSAIAARELAPYAETGNKRVRIDGPEVLLEPDAAQSVAIALHELATNAAKYGALSRDSGRVDLVWTHTAKRHLNLRWTETGGPIVQTPTRHGFGGKVIKQMMVPLDGAARFDWRPEGLLCEISLRT